MDDIQTAVFKATADDKLPPKEKHVLTLVHCSAEGDAQGSHVDTELAKRLHNHCRSPKAANVAAKALVVLHRIVLAGHAEVMRETTATLAGVCSMPQGRSAASDYVADCASYLRALCAWSGVDGLRGSVDSAWHGLHARDVLRALPPLQQLTNRAMDAASGGRDSNPPIGTLRHAIIEDALWLFRAQTVRRQRAFGQRRGVSPPAHWNLGWRGLVHVLTW